MKLFKTIWHAKREAAVKPLEVLDQALEINSLGLEDEKIDAIKAAARKLVDEYKPEAQPTEQPKPKVRVLRTAAQAQARAAALRKANKGGK